MSYFVYILINNIVPISVLIAIGFTMYRAFRTDIKTLSKLIFYVFSPVLVFVKLYESEMSMGEFSQVMLFFAIFFALFCVVAEIVIRIRMYKGGMRSAMRNSVIFYNSANYAIPLNQTVFAGNPHTLSIQIIIMIMQALIPNTFGIYSVNAHKSHWKDTLKIVYTMPVIYAIPVALIMRGFHIPLPISLNIPLQYMANAFMAIALLTLGVQLGALKWGFRLGDVFISNFLRLLIGPVIGLLVVMMLGIEGITAKALILSCAVPTSLSSVLLAVEYDNEAEFSSQAVFSSTMLSLITVPFTIYLLQFY